MADYHVKPNKHETEFQVVHKPTNDLVSIIKKTFLPQTNKRVVFHIHAQPGAPDKGFHQLDSAIKHSIYLHKRLVPSIQHAVEHPMKAVSKLINDLGKAIWHGSSHPEMTPEDHEKINEISKAHAKLVKTFNDHYG